MNRSNSKPNLHKFPLTLVLLIILSSAINAQIVIKSGTVVTIKSGTFLVLQGNYSNAGTFSANSGSTVKFTGTSTQSITKADVETFENIVVDKSSENVLLNNDILVNGTLTLANGNININGNTLSFSDNGSLVETSGRLAGGSSAATRTLNAPSLMNIGGLGALITSTANLGSTTVTRGHTAYTIGGNNSILRSYNISPANNTGLNATLVFCYDDSELNGSDEADLVLFRSTDNGTTWTLAGGTVDTANNKITLSSIDGFSVWTAGDSNAPLPVQLTSFTDSLTVDGLLLRWETATEVNNYGFEVQRANIRGHDADSSVGNPVNWMKLGFIEGHGNSNSPKKYEFLDSDPFANTKPGDTTMYRLKQIDNDGTVNYYNSIIRLDITALTSIMEELLIPEEFDLKQNYPNPFNPTTTIKYDLPVEQNVKLNIYNILGAKVKTLVNTAKKAGRYSVLWNGTNDYGSKVASGMYIYSIQTKEFKKSAKMLLVK